MHFRDIPKTKKIVIFGDGLFAEVAYECFTRDSEYEVAGFAVERAHLGKDCLFELPVVAIEQVTNHFPPPTHEVYVAVVFNQLNRLRARLMHLAEQQGYRLASYVSSHALVWPNVTMGKHCFVFEHTTIQPFSRIGDNVVLWTGTHIGHHTIIGNHVFSARAVVSGSCVIGDYCFLGACTTVANNIKIGDDCFTNTASVVTKDLAENTLYLGRKSASYRGGARKFFKIPENV